MKKTIQFILVLIIQLMTSNSLYAQFGINAAREAPSTCFNCNGPVNFIINTSSQSVGTHTFMSYPESWSFSPSINPPVFFDITFTENIYGDTYHFTVYLNDVNAGGGSYVTYYDVHSSNNSSGQLNIRYFHNVYFFNVKVDYF